jgi:predicted enzyme related to lactoylglutathione lyase
MNERRSTMSQQTAPRAGTVSWFDLTVEDAPRVRDFYRDVVGWTPRGESMGDYEDYSMLVPGTGDVVAGVCQARGSNADLPSQWLIYVSVPDVDTAAATAAERGGRVLAGPRPMGGGRFAVIQDPAGAVFALFAAPTQQPAP